MDPSPTPWRVLEDPAVPAVAHGTEPLPVPTGFRAVSRATMVAVGSAVVLAVAAFVLAFGSGASGSVAVVGGTPVDSQGPATAKTGQPSGAASDGEVVVEIIGAVSHPGVFRLPKAARVGDLLTAAGGYGPRVDMLVPDASSTWPPSCMTATRSAFPSRDDGACREREPRGVGTARPPAGRPARPARSTSTARRRASSTRCPGSARRRRPRSSPRATSSRSARSTTSGRASSSARRRSTASRTS